MTATLFATLVAAQTLVMPATLEADRLQACMDQARIDPAAAITTASEWLVGTTGPSASAPHQCLGFAYMSLLRWDAAQQAFVTARDARLEDDRLARARLGAMAGNAALAGGAHGQALVLLQMAEGDANSVGDNGLAGSIASDKARALVALERLADAESALEDARRLSPQDPGVWLLSAALARRADDLAAAQQWIETAARLDPLNPAIGLEAGLIAALAGFDEAARSSWESVILNVPNSTEAATARFYLEQLDEAPQAQ